MKLKTSAPGRVCLFGEHQDYLGLNVIPAAINMRAFIEGEIIAEPKVSIKLLDLKTECTLDLNFSRKFSLVDDDFDYFRAVMNVFIGKNLMGALKEKNSGFSISVTSEIPIKSGLSSSAALLVAFVKFLDTILETQLSPINIGYYAYLAEHDEMGIPCGQMDQLASAVGNLFFMKCVEPPEITPIDLKAPLTGLVVGDTKIPKSTNNVHSVRVKELTDAISWLETQLDFDIYSTKWESIKDLLKNENQIWFKRMRAAIKNRDLTLKAYEEFKKETPDYALLGRLLDEHQKYLRDDFEVSVEKIETMLDAGRTQGALGGKLTGAGMGGSIIMLAPERQEKVAKALDSAGGQGYVVEIAEGARIDYVK